MQTCQANLVNLVKLLTLFARSIGAKGAPTDPNPYAADFPGNHNDQNFLSELVKPNCILALCLECKKNRVARNMLGKLLQFLAYNSK